MADVSTSMKASQRALVIASLLVLALGLALYCLDYRVDDYYTRGDGRLYIPAASGSMPLPAPIPALKLSEGGLRSVQGASELFVVTVSGLYPRAGMTPVEAAIAGLLLPVLLVIAALYLMLGAPWARAAAGGSIRGAAVERTKPHLVANVDSSMAADRCGRAAFAIIVLLFPVLIVLDVSSVSLLVRFRIPRWAVIWLALRALAAQRSVLP